MLDIYAMSDIHGMLDSLRMRLSQINLDDIRSGTTGLIFLGDYIDRGRNSFKVLNLLHDLQQDLGDNMIVLRGNHDQWFLDALYGHLPDWFDNTGTLSFLSEFLLDDEFGKVFQLLARQRAYLADTIVRNAMESRHKDLLSWLKALPLFYETEH